MKKTVIITFLILLGASLLPQISFAESIRLNIPIGDTTSVDDLGEYIRIFYEFFVTSAGILAVAMIVIGGYKWITAAGNSSIISGAKEQIMSAIFGLILALTSYMILNAINPNITALRPLTIPVVEELKVNGVANRKCDFDTEIVRREDGEMIPVRCGTSLLVNPENQDRCLGVWNKDNDKVCKVTSTSTTPAMLTGEEIKFIEIKNHGAITSQEEFETTDGMSFLSPKECGKVFWNYITSQWGVGTMCDKVPIDDDEEQGERCVMDGEFGNYTRDESVCSWVFASQTHSDGTRMTAAEVRAGCGVLSNMQCAN